MRDGDSVGGEAVRALHVADLGRKEEGKGTTRKAAPNEASINRQLRTNVTP